MTSGWRRRPASSQAPARCAFLLAAALATGLAAADPAWERYDILALAARQIGTTQIRNRGTVGGNLCQRPRCMYFRHPHFLCRKKGGEKCLAPAGEHRY
ncbi:MAG: FAD binding domain-containing protein, partial [Krumholzibacteria bacterium]|nr:FAD binding domain-containing protein [Candidatus Krumholzibacteria bacterium]